MVSSASTAGAAGTGARAGAGGIALAAAGGAAAATGAGVGGVGGAASARTAAGEDRVATGAETGAPPLKGRVGLPSRLKSVFTYWARLRSDTNPCVNPLVACAGRRAVGSASSESATAASGETFLTSAVSAGVGAGASSLSENQPLALSYQCAGLMESGTDEHPGIRVKAAKAVPAARPFRHCSRFFP